MRLIGCIKRALRYIVKGIPNHVITVNVEQVSSGEGLRGKHILITGGGSGFGYSIAKRCIQEGAFVVISGRNKEKLEKAVMELGDHAVACVYDVSDAAMAVDMIRKAAGIAGKLDGLVCNAGCFIYESSFEQVTPDTFDIQFNTNVRGNYFLAKAFAEYCGKEHQDGTILIVSSERGLQCDDVPYGLTRAAINSFTRGLSRRVYRQGIRVNAIAPGVSATDMTGRKEGDDLSTDCNPCGRLFIPEEIAEVACFLLTDASKCISGEVIACDAGGYLNPWFE